jgi:hypothetical protein
MLDEKFVNELTNVAGNVRGVVFLTDGEYIRRHHSDAVLEKVVNTMQKAGHPLVYSDIKSMMWYPLGLRALTFHVIREVLSWTDDEFRNMGNNAPKYSLIVKLLMKWFTSPRTAFNHAPEYWRRHYDVGDIEIDELNEQKCYAIFRIVDFTVTPLYCIYLEGYFKSLFQFTFPVQHIIIQETKCVNRGDPYHEFRADWHD